MAESVNTFLGTELSTPVFLFKPKSTIDNIKNLKMKVLLVLALSFTLSYAQNSNTICNGRQEGLMIPKPGDCTKFYHCSHNVGYLKDCPTGLHFNNRLQVCDWPDKAGCSGSGGSGGCGCETTCTCRPTTCSTTCATTTCEPPTTCSPTTCSPTTCSTTTCEPPTTCTTTTCEPPTTCTTTTCTPWTTCSTTTCTPWTTCSTTTCTPWTTCSTTCSPTTCTTPCVTPPTACDTTTCGCGGSGCSGCSGGSGGKPPGCPNGQYSPYPGNRSKFIVCDHGKSTVMDCPSGLYFNTNLNVCDWPK